MSVKLDSCWLKLMACSDFVFSKAHALIFIVFYIIIYHHHHRHYRYHLCYIRDQYCIHYSTWQVRAGLRRRYYGNTRCGHVVRLLLRLRCSAVERRSRANREPSTPAYSFSSWPRDFNERNTLVCPNEPNSPLRLDLHKHRSEVLL